MVAATVSQLAPPAQVKTPTELLASAKAIALEVASKHAAEVDREARFPAESLTALREAQLLSAGVPTAFGGAGCSLRELSEICATMSQACASTGMVLAMHYIQVACLYRHHAGSAAIAEYLRDLTRDQLLLASMTSEVGTSGDTRSSICAVQRDGERFRLAKDATTGSYCAHADGILVTARSADDAPASDQVLVLVRKGQYTLEQTTDWDTLGMRGTCSPGFKLVSEGPIADIISGGFAESSAETMVPFSHTLWAALWWGIAADAAGRAGAFVRADARRKPGTVPPTAPRLAEVSAALQSLRNEWRATAQDFDQLGDEPSGREALRSMSWALRLNHLKVTASEAAPRIVHQALQIVGVLGYKNNSPFSVGRHYRDSLSASLMIANERVKSKSAAMLLVVKEV